MIRMTACRECGAKTFAPPEDEPQPVLCGECWADEVTSDRRMDAEQLADEIGTEIASHALRSGATLNEATISDARKLAARIAKRLAGRVIR